VVVSKRRHAGAPGRCGRGAHRHLTRYGAVTPDGGQGEAVQGLVLGLRGANAQQVVKACGAPGGAGPTLPPGVTTQGLLRPRRLVERAVGTVSKALLEAIVLVLVLLVLFLGNLRAAWWWRWCCRWRRWPPSS
jgi:cobalt-zinc-cadmium resistance protein CzcA